MKFSAVITFDKSDVHTKGQGEMSFQDHKFYLHLGFSKLLLQFEFMDGYKMMCKACSGIEEVPYSQW